MINRKLIPALAAVAALATTATPAGAITKGQADDGRHPWVGALVSYDPESGDKYLICTGTLVSPKVFVTAAHCLVDEPSDLYVSFEDFVGAPDVGPEVELHHGTAYGHPKFEDERAPGDTHDIAVVVLDAPIAGHPTARLPKRGLMDRLDRKHLADNFSYGVVGYGREGYDPAEDAFFGGGSRRFAFSAFSGLESHKLLLDQTGSTGGTCRGDSGGPVFLGRTRTIIGVTSDGDDNCQENGVYYRLDTASARSFLKPFLRDRGRDDD